MGLSRVALVGMSCQASVTGALEARRVNEWRKRIAWTFGLLCSKNVHLRRLNHVIAEERPGALTGRLIRVNVKGKVLFYTRRREHAYSLKAAHEFTRPGCLKCPDFAAEHADISFGGLGQSDGWTLTIIRTDRGEQIWRDALEAGVIEYRPGREDPAALALLDRLSMKSRAGGRWTRSRPSWPRPAPTRAGATRPAAEA